MLRSARESYDRGIEIEKKMADKLSTVLELQDVYNVELVENQAFWDWTFEDWMDIYWLDKENPQKPDYSYDMYRYFMPSEQNRPIKLLRTEEDLECTRR